MANRRVYRVNDWLIHKQTNLPTQIEKITHINTMVTKFTMITVKRMNIPKKFPVTYDRSEIKELFIISDAVQILYGNKAK